MSFSCNHPNSKDRMQNQNFFLLSFSLYLGTRTRLGKNRSKIKHLLDIKRKFIVYKPKKGEELNCLHHQSCEV